jgi:hypothetical protein
MVFFFFSAAGVPTVACQISDSTNSVAERKARCADWEFFPPIEFFYSRRDFAKAAFQKIAEFGITSKSVAKNGQ